LDGIRNGAGGAAPEFLRPETRSAAVPTFPGGPCAKSEGGSPGAKPGVDRDTRHCRTTAQRRGMIAFLQRPPRIPNARVEPSFAVAAAAAVLLGCCPAYAQVDRLSISPGPRLGMPSPLGVGPSSPAASPRIPIGATELATPNVIPMVSGMSLVSPSMSSVSTCP
jgi:hypothetical protein